MVPFLPHSIRTPSYPYISNFDAEEEEESKISRNDDIMNISKNNRNSFDRMLEGMSNDNRIDSSTQRTTTSATPHTTSRTVQNNNLTVHGRRFPSLSPKNELPSISQPLSLSHSAPDLARRYREEGDLGVVIRRTGASLGFDSIDESIPTSSRKKVSGFSTIFSKVGRKRTKPPTALSLRTVGSNSNINQYKENLLSSPIISSPVNTPRHTVFREQSYFTVPRLERPSSGQSSENNNSYPNQSSIASYSSAFSNFNQPVEEISSGGLKIKMEIQPSPLWSTKSHFSGTSESGNTTPRGNTFPPRIHSSQKNYHQSEFKYPRRENNFDEEDENYFPPSPFHPSRIPLPSTAFGNSSSYNLELTSTPPQTYSDNLQISTPIISIRRPSIPDSPPISIHQPTAKRIKKKEIKTKISSFSSSFQSIEPSSLLSRPSYDLGGPSGWTEMLLDEVGRSETSGTLNEFSEEFEFPWFVVEGSEESGKRKSIFDFGMKEGTSMKLTLDVKKQKGRKPFEVLQKDRTSFFSSTTRTSSGTSASENEDDDVNSEDTSHNRPFHYLTSMLALEFNNSIPTTNNINNDKERVDPLNPSSLISAPSRAYVPLPRSPGLQTLRLVGSSNSLNSMRSSSPILKRTASQDRHQSDPNQYSQTLSNASKNSNSVEGERDKKADLLPSVWPRRPSFESDYTQEEEEVIHSTTLPLSLPNRSLPSSPKTVVKLMESIAVQTDISFPSFHSNKDLDINSTPPRTRLLSLAPTSTFLSPINFRTNNNLEIPSPSSSLNVNYYSSAPSSPKFESSHTTSSPSADEKDSNPIQVERVSTPSIYSSNSNSSSTSTAMLVTTTPIKLIQTQNQIRTDTPSPQSIPSSPENLPAPIRPPRSQKRVRNESISSITKIMMVMNENDSLMDEDWMREGKELRERNVALELEVERLKRVVGVLIGLDSNDEE